VSSLRPRVAATEKRRVGGRTLSRNVFRSNVRRYLRDRFHRRDARAFGRTWFETRLRRRTRCFRQLLPGTAQRDNMITLSVTSARSLPGYFACLWYVTLPAVISDWNRVHTHAPVSFSPVFVYYLLGPRRISRSPFHRYSRPLATVRCPLLSSAVAGDRFDQRRRRRHFRRSLRRFPSRSIAPPGRRPYVLIAFAEFARFLHRSSS